MVADWKGGWQGPVVRGGMAADKGPVVELNVGGVHYTTLVSTLAREPTSLLAKVSGDQAALRDAKGRLFIDRDGVLFRYVLDYLRSGATPSIALPEGFREKERLRQEALYFGLPGLAEAVGAGKLPGYISVGYRGSFQFGRDGLADVKFRKITRILVCGKVNLCREVFGEQLNESRDPDHGIPDRYTARFYLKHTSIEQAFDQLQEQGFYMSGSCASGTAGGPELKPGVDAEESRWNHYNEFIFVRD